MGQRGACARKTPFDVHEHFSLTCCARFGYGSPHGLAVPIGKFGGGRGLLSNTLPSLRNNVRILYPGSQIAW